MKDHLVDLVCGALNPQLRRHLHSANASDVHESTTHLDVVVIDPQRWTRSQRPKCAEGWWPTIRRMLIQVVVQALVDDALVGQAVQLVNEFLDALRKPFQEGMPTVIRDGWLWQPGQSVGRPPGAASRVGLAVCSVAPPGTIACPANGTPRSACSAAPRLPQTARNGLLEPNAG